MGNGTIVTSSTLLVFKRVDVAEAPNQEAANVGAYMPPVDVNTTGNGGGGLPQEPTPPEAPERGFLDGVADGFSDSFDDVWSMLPLTPSWIKGKWETGQEIGEAIKHGDIIDAINVVNPLVPLAHIALTADEADWYTVGQATVGVGVAILSVVVAKKAAGVGKGPKTTRGPPKAGKQQANGRGRKQERLRQIGQDPNTSSADRGWIRQEQNAIARGKQDIIRVPPGKHLAHTRGREAAKGYDHVESPSKIQDMDLHWNQHKIDRSGRMNKERP